ncbi:DUF1765-domain-containing protein [Hesseltinella vesiculosa]|uniref:DUF1765-domain-containing protein n=1 Tax=Hesseltinella vesiculosa TaxID=101127 RepID=A0A1X2G6D6_9FUNG|nr:DUF1765-domain-containing protein [Hesseltinella vesiculosa]
MEKLFPTFLHPLMRCRLLSFKQHFADQTNRRSVLSSSGNWVRRWQSDDSELFFSFYRHYHVTMHSYAMQLSPAPVPVLHRNSILALTPCYLYLASYVSTKIQALLQLQLYSVTTMNKPLQPTNTTSPSTIQAVLAQQQQQPSLSMMVSSSLLATLPSPTDLHTDTDDALVFVPTDDQPSSFLPTSFLSALIPQQPQSKPSSEPPQPTTKTGKPRPLVLATQRYAECLVWCAVQADHAGLYHDMLNVWIRTMVKTTSLVAVENVFCLLDLLESLLIEYQQLQRATPMPSTASTHKDACPSPSSVDLDWSALDLPFVLHTLRLILLRSDHTIVLLRALVFVYRHFDMFASHLLAELCHHVLLVPCVFERLLFHWGYNVRQFYMRLLVFRLGRLWVPVANIAWNPLLLPLTASASSSSSTLSAGSDSASSSSSMTLHSDHSTARLWDAQISAMCDGCLCWKAWHQQKIHAMDSDQRIALEIHLHLEVLLDSFQSRYQGLAMEKAGVPGRCIGGATTSSTEPSLTRPLASQRVVLSTSSTPSPLPPCIRSPRRFYHMSVPRRLLKSSQWLRRSSPSTNDPSRHDDQDGLPWLPPPGFAPGFMYITCTEPDTSTPDWLPWARAWRYQSSRQVYADKVRPELKDILQEYLQWLGNKKSDPANLSVPDLYLDWPKNWSF